jgi:hypothetical protein
MKIIILRRREWKAIKKILASGAVVPASGPISYASDNPTISDTISSWYLEQGFVELSDRRACEASVVDQTIVDEVQNRA